MRLTKPKPTTDQKPNHGVRIKRLRGGLRYAEPITKKAAKTARDLDMKARDLGFASEKEHQAWRAANGIVGPAIRGRRP